ncbi:unnamed protein product [Somion occarium]|uniref:BZIP domain-containing protein n=1 Tax=Somion occarium TaxID=3059160 RepID=A0ABP1EBF8_9APHY
MSSKRGRKRNDNLPPNRARDVQRAFRARRAAHLEALEQRVAELEEENNTLRAALNLPPASRPPLGKGPTGKDKPKPYTPRAQTSPLSSVDSVGGTTTLPSGIVVPASGSGTPSPSSTSTRTHSMSPTMNAERSMHEMSAVANATWGESLTARKEHTEHTSPVSTNYSMQASSTQSHYPYSTQSPSSSRQPLYLQSMTPYSPASADRTPIDGYDFLDRQRYALTQPTYSTSVHDSSQMHNHSPTSVIPSSQSSHGNSHTMHNSIPYPHRRSITEPQGYRPVVMNHQGLQSSLPHAQQQSAHMVRIPSPEGVASVRTSVYDMESRVGRMPT